MTDGDCSKHPRSVTNQKTFPGSYLGGSGGGVRKFTVLTTACTSATFYITIAYTVKKHKHVDEKFGGYLNELGKSYCYDS